jgi:hypothetical protein
MTNPIRIPRADPENEIRLVTFLRARYAEEVAAVSENHLGVIDASRPRIHRDIESKRRIVDLCAPPMVEVTGAGDRERTFIPARGLPWGEPVLLLLALPYENHPDYDEDWRQ